MKMRNSIMLYVAWFSLILIIGVYLFAYSKQPDFQNGVIIIKIMGSSVGYKLWGMLTVLLLLIAFLYLFLRVFLIPTKHLSIYLIALCIGVIFIFLLNHITYGWTTYPPLTALEKNQLTDQEYDWILLCLKGIIATAMAILVYRWYRLNINSLKTSLPK